MLSPWITKGLVKPFKQNKKLYIKFLKNKTFFNEQKYKNFKNLFEKIKTKLKKQYFSSLLEKTQNNAKET